MFTIVGDELGIIEICRDQIGPKRITRKQDISSDISRSYMCVILKFCIFIKKVFCHKCYPFSIILIASRIVLIDFSVSLKLMIEAALTLLI